MYKREIICLKSGSSNFYRLHVYSKSYVTRYRTILRDTTFQVTGCN